MKQKPEPEGRFVLARAHVQITAPRGWTDAQAELVLGNLDVEYMHESIRAMVAAFVEKATREHHWMQNLRVQVME